MMLILFAILLGLVNPFLLILVPIFIWVLSTSGKAQSAVEDVTDSSTAGGCAGWLVFLLLFACFAVLMLFVFGALVAGSDCPTTALNQALGRCP